MQGWFKRLCSWLSIQPCVLRIAYEDDGHEGAFYRYQWSPHAAMTCANSFSNAITIHLIDLTTKERVLVRGMGEVQARMQHWSAYDASLMGD